MTYMNNWYIAIYSRARGRVVKALDPRFRGSVDRFPLRWARVKTSGNLWSHIAFVHPAVMSTKWNEKNWYCVNGYSCVKFPGDETVKDWVPISGGNWCKVLWTSVDIWIINIQLYLYMKVLLHEIRLDTIYHG